MNNSITDVIIHTPRALSAEQFEEVSRQVRSLDGVVSFQQNPRLPGFIMVAYNAGRTQALNILNKVTRMGVDARLVGM